MKSVYSIIVTYNGVKWIDACLKSLLNSRYPTQIIVVDNGSTDTTIPYIKSNFKQVHLIETGKNLGFGQANNWGIGEALKNNADYIFLLNQDAWVEANTLESLIRVQESNPEYGIVSPIHLNGAGNAVDAYFLEYLAKSEIKDYLSKSILNNTNHASVIETSFVNAAGWLLSRECIKKIGGFDPIFFHYGEDRNYTQRVTYHGFKIAIDAGSRLFHDRETRIAEPSSDLTSQFKKDWINELNYFCDIHRQNYQLFIFKRVLKYFGLLTINFVVNDRNKSAYYLKMLKNIAGFLKQIPESRKASSSTQLSSPLYIRV